ncbi:hypothetical protein [Actinoplanes xinjiangensis]|uniref:Uncharacterized protein n=1 Tax=Actinoplanes xinjiangensis TaxID=512350 RepID=A0A316EC47_9ACTN|nr:hypothetical protein [Actinoplanes xinjiangensis]PWK28028.1 hypothetical protein BC793_1512 [Actinoplanes xinjiangensis]GIF45233.1 hypothetical protein Axi01nite_95440 [Actinoplanes xinjiangensis]
MGTTASDGDPFFDAVRLLLLLDAAVTDIDLREANTAPTDAVGVVRTQTLLQKLDFWLRYPDYLADELLTEYEKSGEQVLLRLATQILDSDEPELRQIPMLRFKFGAYEPLDMPMSVLSVAGLAVVRSSRTDQRVRHHDYFLTTRGRQTARSCIQDFPALAWYGQRTRLVVALAQGTGMTGTALRRRQYLQRDYAGTGLNEEIASIAERARQRLAALQSTTAAQA